MASAAEKYGVPDRHQQCPQCSRCMGCFPADVTCTHSGVDAVQTAYRAWLDSIHWSWDADTYTAFRAGYGTLARQLRDELDEISPA